MRQLRVNSKNSNLLLLQTPPARDSQQRCSELLKQIAKGDRQAFACLYQDISPLLFGLILRIVADRPVAEEILLAVFEQVYREAASYDAQRGEALAWILNLARRRALAWRRSDAPEKEFQHTIIAVPQPAGFPFEPENAPVFSTQQELVRAALASLTSIQREVIELAYYGGLSPAEIAARLELSSDSVQKHIRLAMMRLREFLRPVQQEQL